MRIRFTPTARVQFLAKLRHIEAENLAAARRLRARAEVILRRLQQHPRSGRRIPEFPEVQHREVIVPPHRFFYRVEGTTIWIVAVWHSSQVADRPER